MSVFAWSASARARPGWAWPSEADADAGEEVEILAPVGIVQPHALAAARSVSAAAVDLQDVPRFPRFVVHGGAVVIAVTVW